MIKQCPNHGQQKWVLVQTFCSRLNHESKSMLDSVTNGAFGKLKVNEVTKLLDELEANNIHSGGDRRVTKMVASLKDDSSAQIAAILSVMNKRFDILESQVQRKKTPGLHAVQVPPLYVISVEIVT